MSDDGRDYEMDTKDFSVLSPKQIAQQHIMLAIEALSKQQRSKISRMNQLIQNNEKLPTAAQQEWDRLHDDLKSLQRDIELLGVIHRHQT